MPGWFQPGGFLGPPPPKIEGYALPYYDTPGESAPVDLDQIDKEISTLTEGLKNAPKGVQSGFVSSVQSNIDALTAYRDQATAAAAATTTGPPTHQDILGGNEKLLSLYEQVGMGFKTPNWGTGEMNLDPTQFKADVESGAMQWIYPLDVDPATGAEIQRTDLPRVFAYVSPITPQQMAWNSSHFTPEHQKAEQAAAFTPSPALGGGQQAGAPGSLQDRYMTMLENLIAQMSAPAAGPQPQFLNQSQAQALAEAAPQAATPGFTQSAVDPSQLLSLLTGLGQNIGGMA